MKKRLNDGWLFHYGDEKDADFMGWDDGAWEKVDLPHDWAVHFPFDRKHASGTGYLPGGTGWYRKHLTLSGDEAKWPTQLYFEGVYKHARVWINSYYLGQHAYGYTGFTMDVTPFIRPGENVIAVRVEHEDVADSRWFTGSGIDRNVWLIQNAPFRDGSLFLRTVEVRNDRALLKLDYETVDTEGEVLLDVGGHTARGSAGKGSLEMEVEHPRLWSTEDPYLYDAAVCVEKPDGTVTEKETIPFGIRTFHFDADKGFFLNGQNMKIRGVCVHHDAGCLGAAVPKLVWERRLRTLKACGCNAIRTAHNPPDPALLDLCDSMGFLVMDEAFDEWEGTKNKWWQGHNVYPPKHFGYAEDFPEWHERDLTSMICRDRNHACIVMWSIGNEVDYPNDPYVTPLFAEVLGNNDAGKPAAERRYDDRKPDASRLPVIARELVGLVHSLDDTRPVTSAMSFPELSNRTGFADELDMSGYNYRERFYTDDHAAYPGRVILGSENSHDPEAWFAVEDRPYIAGQFLWTGIDFLGECPGWPVRISRAGLLDLAGHEKPLFFQRRALWTTEPFARLAAGKSGEGGAHFREAFAWCGREGEEMTVSCLTNEKEAELFLNGKSLGVHTLKREDGCRTTWTVPFEPGELRVKAGAAEDVLVTPGEPESLVMEAEKDSEEKIAVVEICLLDANGNLCAGREKTVHVQLQGDGELLGLENGKPDDLTPYASACRETLSGRLTAYVRLGEGSVTVHAWTREGCRADLELA